MTKKTIKSLKPFNLLVEVLSVNGGWSTTRVLTGDEAGEEIKVRNGQLVDPTEAQLAELKPAKAEKKAPAAKPRAKKDTTQAQPESGDVLNGDGSEVLSSDALVKPDYARYKKHDVKSPSGRKALDIDDEAAQALRGQDISDCYFIVAKHLVKANGGDIEATEAELKEKYAHLNIGMQRMNLGNRLRKAMGTYGNLNAHKNPAKARAESADQAGSPEHAAFEAEHGEKASIAKYGRRAGDVLKRKDDHPQA